MPKPIGYRGTKEDVVIACYMCRECNTARAKRYRQTKEGKLAIKRAVQKHEAKYPHQRKAWGKALKLDNYPCEVCGDPKADKHHPDYSKPLEVVYLCRLHHVKEHGKL